MILRRFANVVSIGDRSKGQVRRLFGNFEIDFQKSCNCCFSTGDCCGGLLSINLKLIFRRVAIVFSTGDWSRGQAHGETIVRPSTRPPSQVFLIVPWQSFLLWLNSIVFHSIPYHSLSFLSVLYHSWLFHIIHWYSLLFLTFPCHSLPFLINRYHLSFHTTPYYSLLLQIEVHESIET